MYTLAVLGFHTDLDQSITIPGKNLQTLSSSLPRSTEMSSSPKVHACQVQEEKSTN